MTVAWPSFLPKPQRQGHSYGRTDLIQRSEMEGGPIRLRRKFSDGPTQFNISLLLSSRQQWALFEAFYQYDLQQGALEFYLPIDTGAGVVNRRAIFITPPAYDASIGPNSSVMSATVKVIESTTLTADQYAVLAVTPDFLPGEDLLDTITNILYPEALA